MVQAETSLGATFSRIDDAFTFRVEGNVVRASFEDMKSRRKARNEALRNHCEILHDLLADSLEPLTRPLGGTQEERNGNAVVFMSAFDENAVWELRLPPNLTQRDGRAIQGQTETHNASSQIGYRFTRFRFPFIRFDWRVETSNFKVRAFASGKDNTAETRWTAWSGACPGSNSNLVAYGRLEDSIYMDATVENSFVITHRQFIIENVLQPEFMKPKPLLAAQPPYQGAPDVFTYFSSRQGVLQGIRSSQKRMAFLVALSTLLTAFRPIVDRRSSTGGWVLTGVAVAAALVSVISLLLDWMLARMEARAATVGINAV